jgi:hypothetical protein
MILIVKPVRLSRLRLRYRTGLPSRTLLYSTRQPNRPFRRESHDPDNDLTWDNRHQRLRFEAIHVETIPNRISRIVKVPLQDSIL